MKSKKSKSGITLIELLVVVAIVSILIHLVVTSVTLIAKKIKEATTKSNLYALQRAIKNYQINEGYYPQTLQELVNNGYLHKIPSLHLEYHPVTSYYIYGSTPTDSGKWLYDNTNGEVRIDCLHTDSAGNIIFNAWQY